MKKVTLLLWALGLGCAACTSTLEERVALRPVALTAATTSGEEYLTPATVTFNDSLSFETTVGQLVRQLGKPDTIQAEAVVCGGYFEKDKGDLYAYGQSRFEVNGRKAVLRSVDFRSGTFRARLGNVLLDRTTTLAAVGALYPAAYRQVSDWHDVTDNNTYQVMTIRRSAQSNDNWQLSFLNGQLVKLTYYSPC